jgi:hypothetical protein
MWGMGVTAVGMFVYFLGVGFWGFAIAEFVSAIGKALISSALESWLVNVLGNDKAHEVRVRGRIRQRLAGFPAGIVGSLIGFVYGLEWPWFISGLCTLAVLIVGVLEFRRFDKANGASNQEQPNLVKALKDGVRCLVVSKQLKFVALIVFGTIVCFQSLNMFGIPIISDLTNTEGLRHIVPIVWEPNLQEKIIKAVFLGIFWVSSMSMLSFGGRLVQTRSRIGLRGVGIFTISIGAAILISSCVVISGVGPPLLTISVGFFVHEIFRGALSEVLYTYRNRYIKNYQRTTVNSVFGAISTLGAALGLLVSGALGDLIPLLWVWIISACGLVLLGGLTIYWSSDLDK